MRWLLVMAFERPGDFGLDVRDELEAMGHVVRAFAYRRENALYKNEATKRPYQKLILHKLERMCVDWKPDVVLVLKGGPITGEAIRRMKRQSGALFVNLFPDNPLWMIDFDHIEAYDLFLTKERYALRQLEMVGLRNVHYLPLYCVPTEHHPVTPSAAELRALGGAVALVGRNYPYRQRLVSELADYPLRVWGPGWVGLHDPRVQRCVAGGGLWGRDKLSVYSAACLNLNPHHPMNDIMGVNIRVFELAAAGACQLVDLKEELTPLFKPGEEVVAYRDLPDLKRQIEHYLAHPEEARAIGENARRRALAEHTLRDRLDEVVQLVKERFGR